MKRLFYTILISFCLLASVWADSNRYASSSVLSAGKWVKVQVAEDGIYKLTLSDLKKMGFSDLNKVAVYGQGGWPLDEDFSKAAYVDDLPEVAVLKGSDYLLFYGRGPRKWQYDNSDGVKAFVHTNNPYSNYGYYFVTEKETPGKVMETAASADGATLKVTTFDDYYLWEKDLVSVNNSGRELYGESFETALSQDFSVSVPGITNDAGKASLSFIARVPKGSASVMMNIDGESIASGYFNAAYDEYEVATEVNQMSAWNGNKSENVKVNIRYSTAGHKNVRLNYFRLQMKRDLKVYDAYTFFRSLSATGNAVRYVLQGADAGTLVFNVTDGINPKQVKTELSGTELSFSAPANFMLQEFVAVQPSKLKAPTIIGAVENQDLHALPQQDMIIIVQPALVEQAERLAEAHRTMDNMTVKVVTPQAIYNEFSSGTPDATAIRRFMKMFYDRSTSEATVPQHLLLFGDGAFDNRGLTSAWSSVDRSNMLLTYQTVKSINSYSYVVDDYFGYLSDNSLGYSSIHRNKLNIGIGRFPIRTVAEATAAVDKVIAYMENKNTGGWKNNVCFVADDGSNADTFDTVHQVDANKVADNIESSIPAYAVSKVFFDAYKKNQTGGQSSYPDVNATIQKKLKEGLFLLNYTGHGGATAWSDEKVLTQSDIMQADYTSLPIWITATCDFAPFDAIATSAGESVFLNKKSGGIALFTTTRVAYTTSNENINTQLVRFLFKDRAVAKTLGGVLMQTKNNIGANERNLGFSLIGDPALRISYPEYGMEVNAINGQDVSGETITLKALEKVTVKGRLTNGSALLTDFNGSMSATVFDSRATLTTLGNNKVGGEEIKVTYKDYPNIIYKGNGKVTNGEFEFTFVVPKDISYSSEDFGKMSLYAYDDATGKEAQGSFRNYIVGGTSTNPEEDTTAPEVRALFLNDSTFIDGGQVNTTPYFYARVWDQTGINITESSPGHDITLVIDNNPNTSYVLNSYFMNSTEVEGEGYVGFTIPALPAGQHTAEFKIWDVMNNAQTTTFTFEVVEGLKPTLFDVIATPTATRGPVTFHLLHNRPESKMKVAIMVYDLAGRRLWQHEESGSSGVSSPYSVTWDLTNGSGSRMRPGIYLYRATISTDNSKEASKARKMIILGEN